MREAASRYPKSAATLPTIIWDARACPSNLAAESIDPGDIVADDERVDVMRAFVGGDALRFIRCRITE